MDWSHDVRIIKSFLSAKKHFEAHNRQFLSLGWYTEVFTFWFQGSWSVFLWAHSTSWLQSNHRRTTIPLHTSTGSSANQHIDWLFVLLLPKNFITHLTAPQRTKNWHPQSIESDLAHPGWRQGVISTCSHGGLHALPPSGKWNCLPVHSVTPIVKTTATLYLNTRYTTNYKEKVRCLFKLMI